MKIEDINPENMIKTPQSNGYTNGSNVCDKCHKPLFYAGDVPEGGFLKGLEPYCTCNEKKQLGMYGWICPICGAGLSPFTTTCPCSMPKFVVTC